MIRAGLSASTGTRRDFPAVQVLRSTDGYPRKKEAKPCRPRLLYGELPFALQRLELCADPQDLSSFGGGDLAVAVQVDQSLTEGVD